MAVAGNTQAVLFDLDGTLIDSFPGIADAYQSTLRELGLGELTLDQLREFVGPPIQEVLTTEFHLEGSALQHGVQTFRQHYGNEGLLRFTKYHGIDDMLNGLVSRGFTLSIATSKLRVMAESIVAHAGWNDVIDLVCGAELDGSRYLKADVIRWSVASLGSEIQPIAMIGDRGADMSGAAQNQLIGIGVTWGYGDEAELRAGGSSEIASTPDDVVSAILTISESR